MSEGQENKEELMNINDRIAFEMRKRGMTVYQLAKRSKVSKTAVKNWFSPIPNIPNEESLQRIAKVFDMSVEELKSGCGYEKNDSKEFLTLWKRLEPEDRKTVIKQIRELIKYKID